MVQNFKVLHFYFDATGILKAILVLCLFVSQLQTVVGKTQKIVLEKSDTVIDLRGGMFNNGDSTYLVISSEKTATGWIQTKNITIQNGTIRGSVPIIRLGINGEAEGVKQSSFSLGHTERAQAAAPTNIKFLNVTIEGVDVRTLIYIAPGTTYVTVENCTFSGVNPGNDPLSILMLKVGVIR